MNLEDMVEPALKEFMYQGEAYENHTQLLFRFPNGYGASVVTGYGTDIEMAKIFFDDAASADEVDYILVDEPIKNLDRYELNELLIKIKEGTV